VLTSICTDPAYRAVQLGTSKHEVARRVARLSAVQQGFDVLRRGVLAAAPEAVRERLHADVVTVRAVLDAFLHLARNVLGTEVMGHEEPPLIDVWETDRR
jgi:hypothetical protein